MSTAWVYANPLLPSNLDKQDNKRDWGKIGAIIAVIVGALLIGLGLLCIKGTIPPALLGGPIGVGVIMIIGAAIALSAAYIIFHKWQNPAAP